MNQKLVSISTIVVVGLVVGILFLTIDNNSQDNIPINSGTDLESEPESVEGIAYNTFDIPESRLDSLNDIDEVNILECDVPNLMMTSNIDYAELKSEYKESFLNDSIALLGQEYQAMKILFETIDDDLGRIENLSQLRTSYPENDFIVKNLLAACLTQNHQYCTTSIADKAATLDSGNSYTWSLLSAFYYQYGNDQKAAEAMINAGNSNSYDDLFSELMQYQQLGFESVNEEESLFLVIEALGFAADFKSNHLQNNMKFCQEYSSANSNIRDACIMLSDYVIENAGSSVDTQLGYSIQGETNLAAGEVSDYIKTRVDFAAYQDIYMGEDFIRATNLATHDPNLMENWYQTLINYGEPEGANYLIREASQLSSLPFYDPCKQQL